MPDDKDTLLSTVQCLPQRYREIMMRSSGQEAQELRISRHPNDTLEGHLLPPPPAMLQFGSPLPVPPQELRLEPLMDPKVLMSAACACPTSFRGQLHSCLHALTCTPRRKHVQHLCADLQVRCPFVLHYELSVHVTGIVGFV